MGLVRGGTIQTLLKGRLGVPKEPPTPGPTQKDLVRPELVTRTQREIRPDQVLTVR